MPRVCRERWAPSPVERIVISVRRTLLWVWDEQRHYVAPVIAWHVADRSTIRASVGVGLTESSDRYLVRVGWSYELPLRGGK